jgi:hypothetical protein
MVFMIIAFNSASVFFSSWPSFYLRISKLHLQESPSNPSGPAVTADKALLFFGLCFVEASIFFLRHDTAIHRAATINAGRFRDRAREIPRF